jgi:hypothetical protein
VHQYYEVQLPDGAKGRLDVPHLADHPAGAPAFSWLWFSPPASARLHTDVIGCISHGVCMFTGCNTELRAP